MGPETEEGKKSNAVEPKKWWQWFLLYPVLVTSIIAAIPTYVEAFKSVKYDVPYGQASNAKEQDDLWKTNLSCASAPLDPLLTSHNIEVDATICKSGDVLVKIFSPDGERFYKWVAVNKVISEQSEIGWLINKAYASSVQQNIVLALNGTIICQKYLGPGRVLRRVLVTGQGCFDEVVNTYTGAVESTTPVSCNPQC